ncbi:MAG: hypothetical protein KKC72_09475 [Alphaproteobacteria bacterium]|nr:hypothetical protein [Alphaproteobacteria bacterium]MBU1838258.1 hypothetical protein [Alphaproteobacteria bacterium]
MIITTTLGGIAGAIASVLTGMWCGLGVLGLIGLYILGGTVSFAITFLITLKMQAQRPDQGDH